MSKENNFFRPDEIIKTRGDSVRCGAQERSDRIDRKSKGEEKPELGRFSQMLATALGQVEVINISPPRAWKEKEEKLGNFLSEQNFQEEEFVQKVKEIQQILKDKGFGIALEEALKVMMEEVEKSL